MKHWTKRAFWIAAGVALVFLAARAFRRMPILVDTAVVARGTLRVTADDDGRTRVRERYTISAPIGGRLLRTALRAGDSVRAGETVVAEFAPTSPELLDARTRAEAQARLRRAEAAGLEADARREQAEADIVYAAAELERMQDLAAGGIESREALDRALRDERRAASGLRAAEFAVQVAQYELELARASFVESDPVELASDGAVDPRLQRNAAGALPLHSPIQGRVLRVFEESARTLTAGTPILEVGNTAALEIVADYLSQDAVKVRPGMRVRIEGWGGEEAPGQERTLEGSVRVVEPGGFTKISALGVEEQRVNVIVDPVSDEDGAWTMLGDGYRVELRIVLWEEGDVLIVPTGALFREGEQWYVFAVQDEAARRREVTLGQRNGLEAQVLSGLAEDDRVVLYPSELVGEGARLEVR